MLSLHLSLLVYQYQQTCINESNEQIEQYINGNIYQFVSDQTLTIPCGVRIIEKTVYNQYPQYNISKVIIPDSVIYIGQYAFAKFVNMESVNVPESVIEISNYAFSECSSLQEINLPDSIQYIGHYAFQKSGLKTLTVPNSVLLIGTYAFSFCIQLENITLSNQLQVISNFTFENCTSLKNVFIPESVKIINRGAFIHCYSLEIVTLPSQLQSLKELTFQDCINLKSINLPESLEELGYSSFQNCSSLEEIIIPVQIKSIDIFTFNNCTNLSQVLMEYQVERIDNYAFCNCSNLTTIRLKKSVKYVGENSFCNCSKMSCLAIETRIPEIYNSSFNQTIFHKDTSPYYINQSYFCESKYYTNCNNTHPDYLADQNYVQSCVKSEYVYAYYYNIVYKINISVSQCPENYPYMIVDQTPKQCVQECDEQYYIFEYNCSQEQPTQEQEEQYTKSNFTHKNLNLFIQNGVLTIPYGIQVVGMQIYLSKYKDSIRNIIFSDTVIIFGQYSFSNCTNIESLTIPDNIQLIDDHSFEDCQNLVKLQYNNLDILYNRVFYNCKNLQNVTGLQNVKTIGNYTFYQCQSLKFIDTSDQLTYIGDYAFYNNFNFSLMNISKVEHIGDSAFYQCNSIIYIQLPETLTEISQRAFYSCKNLLQVEVPQSITIIDDYAFSYCTKLQTIVIPQSIKQIRSYTFSFCSNLQCIAIQNETCIIASTAFYNTQFNQTYQDYLGANMQCQNQPIGICDDLIYIYTYDINDTINCMDQQYVEYFYVNNESKNIVIDECFGDYIYEYPSTPKECVEECPQDKDFYLTQETFCQSVCTGNYAHPINYQTNGSKICDDQCRFYELNGYRYCTEDCPENLFLYSYSSSREQCVEDCYPTFLTYSIENKCVSRCSGEYAIPYDKKDHVCDKNCPYYTLDNGTLQCGYSDTHCGSPYYIIFLPEGQRSYCVLHCEQEEIYNIYQNSQCVSQCQNETKEYNSRCYKDNCSEGQYIYQNETCYDNCPNETANSIYGYVCDNKCLYHEINGQKWCVDDCIEEELYLVQNDTRDYCVDNCTQTNYYNYSQNKICVLQCKNGYAYPEQGNICDNECQYHTKKDSNNVTSSLYCDSVCDGDYSYWVNSERNRCVSNCQETPIYTYTQDKECVEQCYGEYAQPQYLYQPRICSNSCQFYQKDGYRYCMDNCSGQYPYYVNSSRIECVQDCISTEFNKYYQDLQCTESCTGIYAYNFISNQTNTQCSKYCNYYILNGYKYCIQDCLEEYNYQIKIDLRFVCTQDCEQYQTNYIQNSTCVNECTEDYAYPNDNTNICNDQCKYYYEQKIKYCINECTYPYSYIIKEYREYCVQDCASSQGYYYIQGQECKKRCTDEYAVPKTGNICDNSCLYQIYRQDQEYVKICQTQCNQGSYLVNNSQRNYCVYDCETEQEYNIKYVDESNNLYCLNSCSGGYKIEDGQCVQKNLTTVEIVIIVIVCVVVISVVSKILIYYCYVKKRLRKDQQPRNMIAMT